MNNGVNNVLNALRNGEELTSKQISSRFGISNPRDAVHSIRQKGYPVNLIETVDTKGRIKHKYSMNTNNPSVSTYTVKGSVG